MLAGTGDRHFEAELPTQGHLVMVQVKRVADTSCYVSMLEYGGLEGMILFSEVSTRRIRSMLKEIRVGQFCVCLVLRVEPEKGYVDLSRRRVNQEERNRYLDTYAKSKTVHSTMKNLASQYSLSLREVCEKVAWPLYREHAHAYDAFTDFVNNKDRAIFEKLDVPKEMIDSLVEIVERKMTPQAMKFKAQVHVSCTAYDGIAAVKKALGAVAEVCKAKNGSEMGEVSIKVVAPPLYDLYTQSFGKDLGIRQLEAAIGAIQASIKGGEGGNFEVRKKPEQIGAEDEGDIDAGDLESGSDDDDDEEDEEGMGDANVEMNFANGDKKDD